MKNIIFFALLSTFFIINKGLALTFNVTVPSNTNECWIAGNFKTDVNSNWDINTFKMSRIDDTHFTLNIADSIIASAGLTTGTIRYKYLNGPADWAFIEKNSANNDIPVRSYNTNDFVIKWGIICNAATVRIYTSKSVSECYLIGTFNNWAVPGSIGTKMDYDTELSNDQGNLFYKVVHTPDLSTLLYQFAAGPGISYLQTQGNLSFTSSAICNSAYYDNIAFNRIYNPLETKTVTLNVTAPTGTNTVYLMDSQVQWDGVRWITGTNNLDGTFTFIVNNVDIMQYKYYNSQNWEYNEIDANDADVSDRTIDAQITTTCNDVIINWKNDLPNFIKTDNHNIYTGNKSVTVENIIGDIKVFDFTGRIIIDQRTHGTYTTKTLNNGFYIFQIDNKGYKIFVH